MAYEPQVETDESITSEQIRTGYERPAVLSRVLISGVLSFVRSS